MPRQVLPPARSIGQLLGVSGADELPTIYENQPAQGRVAASVRTLLKQVCLRPDGLESAGNQIISDCKAALELTVLRQQKPERLAARITAFLSHWFIADFPTELRAAALDDWLREFDDVPGWALDFAIQRYMAGSKKKPFPVDIKALLPPELKWARDDLRMIRQLFA